MSSDGPAIEVRGVAKAYNIYAEPRDRLRQAVVPRLVSAARRLGLSLPERSYFSVFQALHSLSFEVGRGETVGVIGRNGAGKSTLLQLVCGTLTPSEGEVRVRGRVAALLELGSGFNPEYTGRENVFLNASLLGLSRAQTEARLEDILAFADIGDFVDQPVKTYSSGMAMRLAFAVIAHVDAEVLIVDEALAVGDAQFQQKCLRWLNGFREQGAVLFVSHDTGAVMRFCNRAIWLERGRVRMQGPAKEVCEAYSGSVQMALQGAAPTEAAAAASAEPKPPPSSPFGSPELPPAPEPGRPAVFDWLDRSAEFGDGAARIESVTLNAAGGAPLAVIEGGEQIEVAVRARALAPLSQPIVGFHVKDRLGQPLLGDNTVTCRAPPLGDLAPGEAFVARFGLRLPELVTGRYSITASVASGSLVAPVQHHWAHDALVFDVHSRARNGVMFAVPVAVLHFARQDAEADAAGSG